jgi:hypothetical protein
MANLSERLAGRPLCVIFVVVATAVPAFGAVVWAGSTVAPNRSVATNGTTTPSTISPYEMCLKVRPDDLPVQYMKGDPF